MSDHGHSCSHEHHDHDHDDDAGGEAWSLYEQINTNALICLNETPPDSLKNILRPWHKRCDPSLPTLKSDVDEQLLLCIPFTNPVKIKSICIIGAGDIENPKTMSAFVNNEAMDFSSAESARPVQEWDLVERNVEGRVEYPTKYARFQNVSKLWLYIKDNFGGEITDIRYLGLKGDFTKHKREAVITVYESRPMKAAEHVKNVQMQGYGM